MHRNAILRRSYGSRVDSAQLCRHANLTSVPAPCMTPVRRTVMHATATPRIASAVRRPGSASDTVLQGVARVQVPCRPCGGRHRAAVPEDREGGRCGFRHPRHPPPPSSSQRMVGWLMIGLPVPRRHDFKSRR